MPTWLVLWKMCLKFIKNHRIPDQETLHGEVTAWANRRNDHRAEMDWRFTTEDARIKLRKLYPTIKT
jgi:hypothetical protein